MTLWLIANGSVSLSDKMFMPHMSSSVFCRLYQMYEFSLWHRSFSRLDSSKKKAMVVSLRHKVKSKFTCIVYRCGDGCSGWFGAKLGHAAASLHSERVVQMRIQVTDNDGGFLQVRRPRLKTDPLTTRDA